VNGTVIFGDVVRSRRDATGATAWLRALAAELGEALPPSDRLADFEFTQGDELQGLLKPGVAGEIDPGRGPATQRTGPAFLWARQRLVEASARRQGLVVQSGDPQTDELLDDIAPLLAELLGDLTKRQRVVARLLLVEELRRSEAAARLDVSRATVSVAADRAHVRSIGRLAAAIGRLFADGAARAAEAAASAAQPAAVGT
jgi:DNA-binding CsgD family transcriptional regulator